MNENEVLENIRRQALMLSSKDRDANEFKEIEKNFVIDDNVEYPDPEYLIEIGDVPTLPKGNLVALSAKWKNGKTFLCDVLSAIFLGSTAIKNCRSLKSTGKVLFYDTEQAQSDTARVKKTIRAMIPEDRHDDLKVYCLRNASIDSEPAQDETICRLDFIRRSIKRHRPDLAVVDGIADLIYNYNDVIESQMIVNELSAIASKYNCCILVVMHQNKGRMDKNMKGHLGTMLYQKCSDVFSVEKHGDIFIASHTVSRHLNCSDIVFKLDADAVPIDAASDRQQQLKIESHQQQQAEIAKLKDMFTMSFEGFNEPLKRNEVVNLIQMKVGYSTATAYTLVKQAIKYGILQTQDQRHFTLKREQQ